MPIEWDSPAPFDAKLQHVLADWLIHVKGGRNPSRDDADTESDPILLDEEDIETFEAFAREHLADIEPDALREILDNAIGFSAWTAMA